MADDSDKLIMNGTTGRDPDGAYWVEVYVDGRTIIVNLPEEVLRGFAISGEATLANAFDRGFRLLQDAARRIYRCAPPAVGERMTLRLEHLSP